MTDQEWNDEIAEFILKVPDYQNYNHGNVGKANAKIMLDWLAGQRIEANAKTLIVAFTYTKSVLTPSPSPAVESEEERETREQKEQKQRERVAHRILLEKENDSMQPLKHVSHREIDEQSEAEEAERQAVIKRKKAAEEAARKAAQTAIAPTIYFESGPNKDRVNWRATEEARRKAGIVSLTGDDNPIR